ncbi:DUF1330 domain-containing protein [Aquibium sp. A9E412]|uniref:DUF1330 domain-containing protein n=1 Tax=Aquibium sp. A9E412 TaxID=2976767 RepID=UPI0025AF2F2B|nr:DUF1330 domain-containing protein [Aquibium sp. A9E412]MDN2568334.1 DUF1330 domain-containing protein [Aquibium sp. A9E412]
MRGYLIFELEITDPRAWEEYRRVAGPIMQQGGGTFVLNSQRIEPLEGGWAPASISVVAFPSYAAAHAFYHSDAYQATIALRQRAARGRGILVGSTPPQTDAQ